MFGDRGGQPTGIPLLIHRTGNYLLKMQFYIFRTLQNINFINYFSRNRAVIYMFIFLHNLFINTLACNTARNWIQNRWYQAQLC
jgi:hypothetical protein